ncbi:tetratricopeptide repeat protein [Parasphaerochaeta coccoides]|uniref:Uncharacterized protein n=1 Tax=Parasphaerochaeta coccoides (strain ATCC BAA-1237 / DSM 17374 / SPN1) TaxID=760011 RepID=F4GLI5_PARC1|nr:tetratricopeptide repeat protein [Parasphaerochaeta coccoides]AEC01955.1 hypothetical protein Spico_0729 [Parasphaerochaeta coccoides DSM 17374]
MKKAVIILTFFSFLVLGGCVSVSQQRETLLAKANILLREGNREDAEAVYRQIIEDFDDDGRAGYNLVALLMFDARYEEASAIAMEMYSLYPEKIEFPKAAARAYTLAGNPDEAGNIWSQLADAYPTDGNVLKDTALFFKEQGNLIMSKEMAFRLLELATHDALALEILAAATEDDGGAEPWKSLAEDSRYLSRITWNETP